MDTSQRLLAVAVLGAFLVGLLLGGAGVAYLLPAERVTGGTSSAQTATGCVPSSSVHAASWVGSLSVDDRVVVLYNRTFLHETAGLDVRGNLTERAPGEWVYAVETTPTDEGKGTPPDTCQPRTTMDASVSVPREGFRSVSVVVDGDVAATVTAREVGTFRPLAVPTASSQ